MVEELALGALDGYNACSVACDGQSGIIGDYTIDVGEGGCHTTG